MPRLHVSPPRTKEQIAAQIRAQFRYAKFTPEDYLKDQALMHRIDRAKTPITVKDFRRLARKHQWSEGWLIACIEDDLHHADRAVKRVLHDEPEGSTVIPRPLLDLYYRFLNVKPPAKVAAAPIKGPGLCGCGCGQKVWGKQIYSSSPCRSRVSRRRAKVTDLASEGSAA